MNKRILIVDDDILIAQTFKIILESRGYKTMLVSSGREVLNTLSENKFDLILMDIDLVTGMTGIDTAKMVEKQYNIPIVFLSNYIEKEILEKLEGVNYHGYVVKNTGEFILDAVVKMAFRFFDLSEKTKKAIEELEVHRIQLEMQVDEQRKKNLIIEELKDKYYSIYNLIPVGIVTINSSGMILENNLYMSSSLSMLPSALRGRPFSQFIFEEDKNKYYSIINKITKIDDKLQDELRLVRKDGDVFWVNFSIIGNGEGMFQIIFCNIDKYKMEM